MIKKVNKMYRVLVGVILMSAAAAVLAEVSQPSSTAPVLAVAQTSSAQQVNSQDQIMPLQAFALIVETRLKSHVLINAEDADTPVRVRKNIESLDYASLLSYLKQNGFTAYRSNADIHFIKMSEARYSAIPVVEKNKTYFDDEYVTDYIQLQKACSMDVLSTLRPLVPQESHLAVSNNPEMLLITDTYSNIQRLKVIIKQMEAVMEKPSDCRPKKQK